MIFNSKGATLPQVLIITTIVGGLSAAIMQSVNLANRLKAQNDAALMMDKIANDLTEKLADPEVCGVRYEALAPDTIRGVTNYRRAGGADIGNFEGIDLSIVVAGGKYKASSTGIQNSDNPSALVYTAVGDNQEGIDRKARVSGLVMIKEFSFENFTKIDDNPSDQDALSLATGEHSGNVDLRIVFYKRRSGVSILGGSIGSRVVTLRVHLDNLNIIKKCYSNSESITFEGTRQTCNEVGGSFRAGRCIYNPTEKDRILKQLCDDMYGLPTRFDAATKNCNHPSVGIVCGNGIRGFNSTGRVICQ